MGYLSSGSIIFSSRKLKFYRVRGPGVAYEDREPDSKAGGREPDNTNAHMTWNEFLFNSIWSAT